MHAEAKAQASYRFYALYDKLFREDILAHAYALCRSHRGAPGVDGQDFENVEAYGVERWLAELAAELREECYRPEAIRRVYIPKANGKLRPLSISTLRDRVCMTAAMQVLEPIVGRRILRLLKHWLYCPVEETMNGGGSAERRRPRTSDAGAGVFPPSHLYGHFGLVRLTRLGRGESWVKA